MRVLPGYCLMLMRFFALPVLPLSLVPSELASINRSYPHPAVLWTSA